MNQLKKVTLFIAISMIWVNVLKAQNTAGISEYSFGIEGAQPLGNFQKDNKMGFGGSIKYAYNITENTAISLQVGYLHFGQKDSLNNPNSFLLKRIVPVLVGIRYNFNSPFYVEPQLGATNAGYQMAGEKENQTNIGYGLNIGYLTRNHWDFSLNMKATIVEKTNVLWCGVKFAYNLPIQ